jgi:hypothetical protein
MFSEIQLAQSAPAAGTIQRQIDYASSQLSSERVTWRQADVDQGYG